MPQPRENPSVCHLQEQNRIIHIGDHIKSALCSSNSTIIVTSYIVTQFAYISATIQICFAAQLLLGQLLLHLFIFSLQCRYVSMNINRHNPLTAIPHQPPSPTNRHTTDCAPTLCLGFRRLVNTKIEVRNMFESTMFYCWCDG